MILLSSFLIHSVISSEYESKYYEYGVLRSLGFMKTHLVQIVTFKSLYMSTYGIVLGLITAYLLNVLVRMFLFRIVGYTMSYDPTGYAVIMGVVVGILMPFFSNYSPV